jgi:hypothetical protein
MSSTMFWQRRKPRPHPPQVTEGAPFSTFVEVPHRWQRATTEPDGDEGDSDKLFARPLAAMMPWALSINLSLATTNSSQVRVALRSFSAPPSSPRVTALLN